MGRTTIEATQAKGLMETALVRAAERRGIDIGMCLACALLIRDFGDDTRAEEILEAANIDADRVRDLDLDEYDTEPLLKLLEPKRD